MTMGGQDNPWLFQVGTSGTSRGDGEADGGWLASRGKLPVSTSDASVMQLGGKL